MKNFKQVELPKDATLKIVGGNGGSNASEDGPTTDLGTVTNDGDA